MPVEPEPDRLLPTVYDALRKLAERRLAAERPGHTLQATALVHDVYLRLAAESPDRWADAAHFYRAAAAAMRHVLVDHAKARRAAKRGGAAARVPLTEDLADAASLADTADPEQVLALEAAVSRLEVVSPEAGAVVRMRFYAGLSVEQTAEVLGLSRATVTRKWTYARVWLFRALSGPGNPST